MDDKYLHFSVEDFLSDSQFLHSLSHDKEDAWHQWLAKYPNMQKPYEEAKSLITSLKFKDQDFTHKEQVWQQIENTVNQETHEVRNAKLRHLKPIKLWIAAASFILLAGISYLFFNDSTTEVFNDQLLAQTLQTPHGSVITLEPGSQISYAEHAWNKNRQVKLIGKAEFDVTSGVPFQVITPEGIVTVLGTQFTVEQIESRLSVHVTEGKVEVLSDEKKQNLTAGMSFYKNPTYTDSYQKTGIENEKKAISYYHFKAQPMSEVIAALENEFGITVHMDQSESRRLYTGGFGNDSLDRALETVLWPMSLRYNRQGKMISVLKE